MIGHVTLRTDGAGFVYPIYVFYPLWRPTQRSYYYTGHNALIRRM